MRRLHPAAKSQRPLVPPDRAWHEMLARLDAEEADRRLAAMEAALNGKARH